MQKTIIVTGGCGFIGSHLVKAIAKQWHREKIVIIDPADLPADLRSHSENHIQQEVNAVSLENAFHGNDVGLIFHLGAETHVGKSWEDPTSNFFSRNAMSTAALMIYVSRLSVRPRIVAMSTDEVFGDLTVDADPLTQSWNGRSRYNPRNPYAASKAAADMMAIGYKNAFGLDLSLVHCVNVFGAGQTGTKLFPAVVDALVNERAPTIHGDGTQMREWVHVDDVVKALMLIAPMGHTAGDHVCIGTGVRININAIVDMAIEIATQLRIIKKDSIEPRHVDDPRPRNDRSYGLRCSPELSERWAPSKHPLHGLKEMLEAATAPAGATSRPKLVTA